MITSTDAAAPPQLNSQSKKPRVELDSATPHDTPVFALCKTHRERSLPFGQLKEALAKRSTTPAWLPV